MTEEGGLRYTIDTNTLGNKVLGQSAGEPNNRAFGSSIIDHRPGTTESHNRSSVNDPI